MKVKNPNLKKRINCFVLVLVTLTVCIFSTGCDTTDRFDELNAEGYTVSVKFDANGGSFGDNAALSVIIDSFNPSENSSIALITPDNPARGDNNAFTVKKAGHFLAGWYKECVVDGENVKYSGKWDFEKDRLEVDKNKAYNSEEPVMTLYAAWIPMFDIEFYNLDNMELIETIGYDPTFDDGIQIPYVDDSKGEIKMYDFPEIDGFTYVNAYFDDECTLAVDEEKISHPGVVNYDDATATDTVLKLYVEYKEGEWYYIYNAKQLNKLADEDACFEICADLDLGNEKWPKELLPENFNGTIIGNGHTVSNVNTEGIEDLEAYEQSSNLEFKVYSKQSNSETEPAVDDSASENNEINN